MKKWLMISFVAISVVVVLLIIPKVSKVDIGDGGLLSEEPCGPDCFFGITPSMSTQDDVDFQLSKYKLRIFCKKVDSYGTTSYHCDNSFIINISQESKKVLGIGYTPTENVNLGAIINKYGVPDFLVAYDGGTTPEYPLTFARLYFYKYNMCIEFSGQEGSFIGITPDLIIAHVEYAQDFSEIKYPNFSKQSWKGYGDYYQVRW